MMIQLFACDTRAKTQVCAVQQSFLPKVVLLLEFKAYPNLKWNGLSVLEVGISYASYKPVLMALSKPERVTCYDVSEAVK